MEILPLRRKIVDDFECSEVDSYCKFNERHAHWKLCYILSWSMPSFQISSARRHELFNDADKLIDTIRIGRLRIFGLILSSV